MWSDSTVRVDQNLTTNRSRLRAVFDPKIHFALAVGPRTEGESTVLNVKRPVSEIQTAVHFENLLRHPNYRTIVESNAFCVAEVIEPVIQDPAIFGLLKSWNLSANRTNK